MDCTSIYDLHVKSVPTTSEISEEKNIPEVIAWVYIIGIISYLHPGIQEQSWQKKRKVKKSH